MKKIVLALLFLNFNLFLNAQVDIFWNSLLPNGMDFSKPTKDRPYSYTNIPVLDSLRDIVATAYLGDTLFATDGSKLYVILNGTLIGQYTINNIKAGRDQAFLLVVFKNEKRQLKIITSVNNTLKIFTWPDIEKPSFTYFNIEPAIYVKSEIHYSYGDFYNSAVIAFLEHRTSNSALLRKYNLYFSGDTLISQLDNYTKLLYFPTPAILLRYSPKLIVIKNTLDSTYVWNYDQCNNIIPLDYYKIGRFNYNVRDVIIGNQELIVLSDTSIYGYIGFGNICHGIGAHTIKYASFPKSYMARQLIFTPYGQIIVIPRISDSVYILYNFIVLTHRLHKIPLEFYIPRHSVINVVDYYPLFNIISPTFLTCQSLKMKLAFSRYPSCCLDITSDDFGANSSLGEYVFNVDIPPKGEFKFIYPYIKLSNIQVNKPLLLHSNLDSLPVTAYIEGDPIRLMYNPHDFHNIHDKKINIWIWASIPNNIYWYRDTNLIAQEVIGITSDKGGLFKVKIRNKSCVASGQIYALRRQIYGLNLIGAPYFFINGGKTKFFGDKIGYAIGDSIKIKFNNKSDYCDYYVPEKNDYQCLFFWDGKFVGKDSSFTVSSELSKIYKLDVLWMKKNDTDFYNILGLHSDLPVINPDLYEILPQRKYAIGDTFKIKIASDSANADIYINDKYTLDNYFKFKQINDTVWEANITNSYFQNKKITHPDSLRVILWLATNTMDKIKFTLISPNNKKSTFYTGFNATDNYYIIGQPFCGSHITIYDIGLDINFYADYYCSKDYLERKPYIFTSLYPIVFSGYGNRSLDSSFFINKYYSDCDRDINRTFVFNYGENEFIGNFSNLLNASIYGKWKIIVHKPNDSSIVIMQPLMELPFIDIKRRFSDNRSSDVYYSVYENYTAEKIAERLDTLTYKMNKRGHDSLMIQLSFYVKNRVSSLNVVNRSYNVKFIIDVEKRNIYYDNQTYLCSPNGDGVNDYWNPLETIGNTYPILKEAQPSSLLINIVNDKGLVIRSFTMADEPKGWDGLDKDGRPVPGGVYWYIVFYRDQKYYGTIFIVK